MSRRPNQVSLKDLFTTNPGELLGARYASDSALDSASQGNSQFPYSQAEFFDSQDGQQLPHSQNLSQSPATRFFNRYMAKGSVVGHDGSQSQMRRTYSASSAPKLPSQQQFQLLKARSQEQDERDLWNSLVSGIRECSAEVRVAVACLKESTQLGIGSTECQLTTFVEKIQSSLEKSQSVIVETLSNKDNGRTTETELQQELAIKTARIEELERHIQKMMQEKQDGTIASLQSTCEDLSHKITESIEHCFCHNQTALTHLEAAHEKHNQNVLVQMKQCLQKNRQDQQESISSLLESFNTLTNETTQKQSGILTSELMKSLHIVQENQQKGLEELLVHKVKELLEKKELQQKELFEKQHQKLSAIEQEQRLEMLTVLQSQIQHSNVEQKKHLTSIVDDCMSQEKNRCSQMLKELKHLSSLCQRCGKELEGDTDPVSSKPHLRDRTNASPLKESADLLRNVNKNDSPADRQPEEALEGLSISRKAQCDTDSVSIAPTKGTAHIVNSEKTPSTTLLSEVSVDSALSAISRSNTKFDEDLTGREATGQNTSCKENKPVKRGKAQLPEIVDPAVFSPLPSGTSRFSDHSHICNDRRVNPSPVALVLPQVQATKTLQLEKNSSLLVTSVVQSTTRIPTLHLGTTQASAVKDGSFAAVALSIPAALPASVAKAKAPTSQVETSSASRVAAFANAPTPLASSMKTTVTKGLSCNDEMQRSNSPARSRKVSKKRRGKWTRASQSRKRARKQPVVELGGVSERCSKVDSRKLVTNRDRKNEKVTSKKPTEKQSVICKVVPPTPEEVFDFHSDTSDGSDSDSPLSHKRIAKHETKLSAYSMETLEGRRMTPATFNISERRPARNIHDFLATYSRAANCHHTYSTRSKSSTTGKARALSESRKEKCYSADQENDDYMKRDPCSDEGHCSSSASSSPCWSLGDILKLSEV